MTTPKRTLSDTYSTLGLIERSQDNIDEAIKMFAKAVETDGSNDLPRTNLAYTKFFQVFYADQDDDRNTILLTDEIYAAADENLPAIDEAIALNPTRTHNYVSKTEILYAVRLLDLALGSARRGLPQWRRVR